MLRLLVLSGCLYAVLAGVACATEVPDLYEASVPVPDRSDATRQTATRDALGVVLVKVTGRREAAAEGAAAALLGRAQSFVQQYQYSDDPSSAATDSTTGTSQLQVQFDAGALAEAMRQAGSAPWGRNRPATLLWLGVETGVSPGLAGADDASGVTQAAIRRARGRGVPMVLPLLDLEDEGMINLDDLRGGARDRIVAASQRYGVDGILIGVLRSPATGAWTANWNFFLGDQTMSWVTQGDAPDAVVVAGVDGFADRLAAQFNQPVATAGTDGAELVVQGISSVDDYARVQKYLGSLDIITRVDVRRVDPGQVSFYVVAHGGTAGLAQTLALGQVLRPADIAGAGASAVYQLAPY